MATPTEALLVFAPRLGADAASSVAYSLQQARHEAAVHVQRHVRRLLVMRWLEVRLRVAMASLLHLDGDAHMMHDAFGAMDGFKTIRKLLILSGL